jgi:hypothetical protein
MTDLGDDLVPMRVSTCGALPIDGARDGTIDWIVGVDLALDVTGRSNQLASIEEHGCLTVFEVWHFGLNFVRHGAAPYGFSVLWVAM